MSNSPKLWYIDNYYTVLTVGGIGTTMATKKASTKKSTSSRTVAAKKTTTKKATTQVASVTSASAASTSRLPSNLANIILAELVGTFVLTLVALTTASIGVLYVGLAVVVLFFAVGVISGAHLNPAVTFGLWSARRLKTIMVPFYWGAQIVGALLAIGVLSVMTSGQFVASNTWTDFAAINWSVLFVELIGTAVFMFGLVAVVTRDELTAGAKALGVGLSLLAGLTVGGSLLSQVQSAAYQDYQKQSATVKQGKKVDLPHALLVKGAVLNPAVATAVTQSTESQLMGSGAGSDEKQISRFGLEVILGALAGAAVGANLYVLLTYKSRR